MGVGAVWVIWFGLEFLDHYGKLSTYPSPKPTLTIISHLGQNVTLGEGWVGSFSETYNPILFGQTSGFRIFSPVIQRCKILDYITHNTPWTIYFFPL